MKFTKLAEDDQPWNPTPFDPLKGVHESHFNIIRELNRLFAIVRSRTPEQLASRFSTNSSDSDKSDLANSLKQVNDFLDWSDEEPPHNENYDWSDPKNQESNNELV